MGNKKGAGSFYQTLDGYARHHQIDFVSHGPQSGLPASVRCHPINLPIIDGLIRIPIVSYIAYPLWWLAFVIKSRQIATKLIFANRPDVIYAYEIQAVPVAYRLSRKYKISLVSRFQGTKLQTNKIDNIWYRCKMFDHIIALKTPTDLVIMANDGTQGDRVLQRLDNTSKMVFWLNGVEKPKKYSPVSIKRSREALGFSDGQKLILMASRLVNWKRVDRIISTLPHIEGNYKLIIAGDGPERSRLEDMVKQYDKLRNVKFLGAVKQGEIDRLMAAADIFISLYDLSNVGNPLLQAMNYGKAIVTLDNGGTKQFIDNTRGILLPPDKPDRLADSINKLLNDIGLRRHLGTNAKKFAQNNFWSWNGRIKKEIEEVNKLTRN